MTGRPPRPSSMRQRILALLDDGRPRTSTEVLRHIADETDRQVRDTLHDLQTDGLILNHRRSPEEGLWERNDGDNLKRRADGVKLPAERRQWWEL